MRKYSFSIDKYIDNYTLTNTLGRLAQFVELGFAPVNQKRAKGLLTQPAKAHYIIATKTLDEFLFDRIANKQYLIRTVLDNLTSNGYGRVQI